MTTTSVDTLDPTHVVGMFDEACFGSLPTAAEPELVRTKRNAAFEAYRALPAPTNFDEEWRRTPPQLFPFDSFQPLPLIPRNGTVTAHPMDEAFDVVVAVNDDSFAIEDRSGLLSAETIVVMPLAEAAEAHPELVQQYVGGKALPSDWDKFVALNHAYHNFGLFIHIPKGVVVEKGILIRYSHQKDGAALIPRLVAVAGEQSQATVTECVESPDEIGFLSVSTKELYVGQAARLKMISLQEFGRGSYQVGNDMALVERDAQVDWITLNFGTKASKLKFGSDVAGEGSSAELDGLFFCDLDQHIDQKTLQIHSAPNTYSRLLYKGAVQDKGHSVYQGVIQARPGAIKVDSYQTNNNLILTDGAQADTIPGLLIDADDLKCSHGATIGNLDPDQMFYLRSRGFSEAAAKRILVLGFYDEIADRIPYESIRARVHAIVEEKLHGLLEAAAG